MCSDTDRGPYTRCAYPGCSKYVWEDADGSYSSYCGRTHRDAMVHSYVEPEGGFCQNCGTRPVYIENGQAHDYCGLRCANEASNGSSRFYNERKSSAVHNKECKYAGCYDSVYIDRDGFPSQYCSQAHQRQAVADGRAEACLLCMDVPKAVVNGKESDFCGRRCMEDATNSAPIIFDIPARYNDYHNIKQQFHSKWKHEDKAVPTVIKLWKIYGTMELNDKFSRYRTGVERSRHLTEGNTRRRFHGTLRECCLGDDYSCRDLCNSNSCSLCRIIASSFEIAQAGSHHNYGRFGRGIYTSATSSKADDYVREDGGSQYKAMLMNQVVMGKAIKLYEEDQSLTRPPPGYDSVIGEPGHELNYDEAIVYRNDAIKPLFLIVYTNED